MEYVDLFDALCEICLGAVVSSGGGFRGCVVNDIAWALNAYVQRIGTCHCGLDRCIDRMERGLVASALRQIRHQLPQ